MFLDEETTKKKERERHDFYENCTFKPLINKQNDEANRRVTRSSSANLYEQALEQQRRKEQWREEIDGKRRRAEE